jgi:Zn ribbon nucleic-acid-binding protein
MESAIFNNRSALLVTMHGKEKAIAPFLSDAFNIHLEVSKNIDTDVFGSFSGEVERKVSPQLAAQQKIFAAWNDYDHEILIASEGSFFPHPSNPFLNVNNEYLILIDRKNKVAVDAQWNSLNINYFKQSFSSENLALQFCLERGFPSNGVILKINMNTPHPFVLKDITTVNGLSASLSVMFNQSLSGEVEIESDMRAHRNPQRMENIALTAKHLVNNMRNNCPNCQTLGFSIKNSVAGLECSSCGFPSEETKGFLYSCKDCNYEEFRAIDDSKKADPGNCSNCNP